MDMTEQATLENTILTQGEEVGASYVDAQDQIEDVLAGIDSCLQSPECSVTN